MTVTKERLQHALDNGHKLETKVGGVWSPSEIKKVSYGRVPLMRVRVPDNVPEKHHEAYRARAMGACLNFYWDGKPIQKTSWVSGEWGEEIEISYSWPEDSQDPEWGEWVEWSGGTCPVALLEPVEVRLRSGTSSCDAAQTYEWRNYGSAADITAYRRKKVNEEPYKYERDLIHPDEITNGTLIERDGKQYEVTLTEVNESSDTYERKLRSRSTYKFFIGTNRSCGIVASEPSKGYQGEDFFFSTLAEMADFLKKES